MTKYLVLGSAPGLVGWCNDKRRLFGRLHVCPINNAWQPVGADAVGTWFRSLDFYVAGTVLPGEDDRKVLEQKEVTKVLRKPFYYDGDNLVGTMLLGVLSHLHNVIVAGDSPGGVAVAFTDLVYPPGGVTHWYGPQGAPDPLRYDDLLDGWLAKTKDAYERSGISLVNVSPPILVSTTRLPFPRTSIEEFAR